MTLKEHIELAYGVVLKKADKSGLSCDYGVFSTRKRLIGWASLFERESLHLPDLITIPSSTVESLITLTKYLIEDKPFAVTPRPFLFFRYKEGDFGCSLIHLKSEDYDLVTSTTERLDTVALQKGFLRAVQAEDRNRDRGHGVVCSKAMESGEPISKDSGGRRG